MPRTKKRKAAPRRRTCLNIEVSPAHLAILTTLARERSALAGRTVTKSDLVRDWIWEHLYILGPENNSETGVDNANTTPYSKGVGTRTRDAEPETKP